MPKPKLRIFKNKLAGQPVKRKDGSVVEYNGEDMLHCQLNGTIELPEGLAAGEYEVAIYQNTAKSGLVYYAGNIKPAFKKENKHSVDKGNAYQPQDMGSEVPF